LKHTIKAKKITSILRQWQINPLQFNIGFVISLFCQEHYVVDKLGWPVVWFRVRLVHMVPLEHQLVRAQLANRTQPAKSPRCAWPLQRRSPSAGCRSRSFVSWWYTAMTAKRTMYVRFLIALRRWPISTHVSTRSSTLCCGDLSASPSCRWDELDLSED